MENATKALLIAGSVFIVIVLIAVGVRILGSTEGVVDEVEGTSESFGTSIANSYYTDYVGTRTGAEVKSLLTKVTATHRTGNTRKISVEVTGGDGLTAGTYSNANEIATVMSSLKINSSYTIGVKFDNEGYVNAVTIQ